MASKTTKLSTNNLMAAATVVVILMLVIVIVVGRGLFKSITHNSAVIGKKQKAESQLKENLTALPSLTSAYQALGSTKDLIAVALPTDTDFPGLVATTETIAGASGVSLTSVAPQLSTTGGAGGVVSSVGATPTTNSPTAAINSINANSVSGTTGAVGAANGPQVYAFTISAKGTYATLVSFLTNLQVSARPIKITDVQLSGNTAALTATINAQTYYFAPKVLQDKTETVK